MFFKDFDNTTLPNSTISYFETSLVTQIYFDIK